jgi:2-iminobutanoate/2-iminopropanoate deaminase
LVDGGVAEQAEQVMKNIRSVLESAGSNMNQVLKVTILLTDISHFGAVNTVYARYFGYHKPARAW